MFSYGKRCGHMLKDYLLLQGDRVVGIGCFCLLTAALYSNAWIPLPWTWSPWSNLAVLWFSFAVYWRLDSVCEGTFGRWSPKGPVEGPRAPGRLVLGAVLSAVLVAGGLLGFSLASAGLAAGVWIFAHLLQVGRLRLHYILFGVALISTGISDVLGAFSGEPVTGPWFIGLVGAVVLMCAVSDQDLLRKRLRASGGGGDYDV